MVPTERVDWQLERMLVSEIWAVYETAGSGEDESPCVVG